VFLSLFFFFFNDTATTEIYTLSLHDALPIFLNRTQFDAWPKDLQDAMRAADRKSTRLNSSHPSISYAVFCLKKKSTTQHQDHHPRDRTEREHTHELASST